MEQIKNHHHSRQMEPTIRRLRDTREYTTEIQIAFTSLCICRSLTNLLVGLVALLDAFCLHPRVRHEHTSLVMVPCGPYGYRASVLALQYLCQLRTIHKETVILRPLRSITSSNIRRLSLRLFRGRVSPHLCTLRERARLEAWGTDTKAAKVPAFGTSKP